MRRLLIISREYPPMSGGVSVFMSEVLKRIKSIDYTLITHYVDNREKKEKLIEVKKTKIFGRSRYFSAYLFLIETIFKALSRNYDLIVGNALIGSTSGILVKFFKRKPLISVVFDIDQISEEVEEFSPTNKFFRKIIQRLIFLFSDEIIVPSKKVQNNIFYYHGINPKKITIIPCGAVDLSKIKITKKNKQNKYVLLFVSELYRKKGLEYLIKAFYDVNKHIKNTKLYVVGSHPASHYYEYIKKIIKKFKLEKNIIFEGYIPHEKIFSYYDFCDIFVATSYHSEGFGIPCVEASAMGKPIIATKIFEETGVVVNEKNGLIVPPKNPKELSKAIIRLLKDKELRKKLGKNGKIMSKRYNWNLITKKFEDTCLKVF